jgi:ribosome recycling factor
MVTRIKDLSEDGRISLRNIRRDAIKAADTAEKDKTISEDERDDIKDEAQKLIKKYEDDINGLAKAKETEVMDD